MRRTTVILDEALVAEAREALGARTTTETIHLALARVVRDQRLRDLAGQRFPDLTPAMIGQLRGKASTAMPTS